MGSVGMKIGLAFVAVLCGCGNDIERSVAGASADAYRTIGEVYEHAISRTCSLNNGVCHNSNSYPDLATIAAVVDTIEQPCNVDAAAPELVHDACEPRSDLLVVAGKAFSARITRAWIPPADFGLETKDLTRAHVLLEAARTGLAVDDVVEVHRDGTVFKVGARVVSITGAEVVLALPGELSSRWFFDTREFPTGALQVRAGDVNSNGIEGALVAPMPLVAIGDPHGSYLFKRLVDEDYGELMPRQCRTWDARANHAIGCWIAGLAVDDTGRVTNAYDPIDYASCDVERDDGKCVDGSPQ